MKKGIYLLITVAVLAAAVCFFISAPDAAAEPTSAPSPEIQTIPEPTQPSAREVFAETLVPEPEPDPVKTILDSMTMAEKVGQLFLAQITGGQYAQALAEYPLGGIILFGPDLEGQDPESMAAAIRSWQDAASIPLLIAADEEGGTVCRVSSLPAFRESPFLSPRDYYAQGGMNAVLAGETEKCILLKSIGIRVNMGPVCDIATDRGAFMYRRSLGQSPEVTAQFITETVDIMQIHQIGSVLKHFPGYGNNPDTHTGTARDSRSLEELENCDLIPFQAGIDAGCGAVMVSHTIVEAFDKELPATLSPAVHHYLRDTMGFQGVIVTDDLNMGAITGLCGKEEAAVLAVLAGNDLLCTPDYAVQYAAVLEAVETGRIPMELLDAAVLRILHWKYGLGLLTP